MSAAATSTEERTDGDLAPRPVPVGDLRSGDFIEIAADDTNASGIYCEVIAIRRSDDEWMIVEYRREGGNGMIETLLCRSAFKVMLFS